MTTHRTTIVLPLPLRQQVSAAARAAGVSFGEFVRQALRTALIRNGGRRKRSDPLLDDDAVFRGRVPADLSENHDSYLYGE